MFILIELIKKMLNSTSSPSLSSSMYGKDFVETGNSSKSNRTTTQNNGSNSRVVYSDLNPSHHHINIDPQNSCKRTKNLQQQDESANNSRSSLAVVKDSSNLTTWGNPLNKKPRLVGSSSQFAPATKVNFPNFLVPALLPKSARVEQKIHKTPFNKSNPAAAASLNVETSTDQAAKQHVDHEQSKAKGIVAANNNEKLCNEPLLPSSSACSLGASNNPNISISIQEEDTTDDSASSTDNDEETEDNAVMKETPPREGSSRVKRSRNAHIHSLPERKRRDKINKKIRTLKELIPNCNKTDKASMLDDAIDYLRTLKLQLQMMSMSTGGLCMPFMMLPGAANHHHHHHLVNAPHFQLPLMGGGAGGGGMCFGPPQFPIPPPLSAAAMFGNFSNQMRTPISQVPFIPMTGNSLPPPSSSLVPSNQLSGFHVPFTTALDVDRKGNLD